MTTPLDGFTTDEDAKVFLNDIFTKQPLEIFEAFTRMIQVLEGKISTMQSHIMHAELCFNQHRHDGRDIVAPIDKHPKFFAARLQRKTQASSALQMLATNILFTLQGDAASPTVAEPAPLEQAEPQVTEDAPPA